MPALRRYATGLVGRSGEADDLVQECVERALRRPETLQQRERMGAWLRSILHNLFVDDLRRRRGRGKSVDVQDMEDDLALSAPPEDRSGLRDFGRAMASLSHEHRQILLLVGVEGLSYRQIAEELAIPLGTVMSRLARARERLRLPPGSVVRPCQVAVGARARTPAPGARRAGGRGREAAHRGSAAEVTASMPPIGEEDLHAFIDGELDPDRRAAVQAALARDPVIAWRIAAFRADKQRLAALYGPVADRPLPAAWLRRIEAASRPRSQERVASRWRTLAAAAVLLAAVGAGAVLLAPSRDTILAEAAAAHDGTLRARQILAGAALPPPGVGNRLLQATLGLPVRTPDLTRYGFRLAAVDVFQPPTRPAVGLVYRDAGQRELTIYLRRSAGEARFDLLRRGHLRVCIWQDDVLGAVMTADMTAGEMMRIASRAYVELNL